jgi:hypothetical protein
VEQAKRKDSCGGEEQTDCLIAVEAALLGFAAGVALLFGGEALDGVVHSSIHYKAGGILAAVYRRLVVAAPQFFDGV